MRRRLPRSAFVTGFGLSLVAGTLGLGIPLTQAAAGTPSGTSYSPGTPQLATITNGSSAAPWNEWQGDSSSPTYNSQSPGTVLPTYTPGGAQTGSGTTAEPNLSVYPGASSGTDGDSPYPSGTVGTPGPDDAYCGTGNNTAETTPTSAPVRQPAGTTLPLGPAYFPHIVRNADGSLTGYFDYRPKDTDEAIVAATSTNNGKSWTYQGESLEQNAGYCPNADINDDGQGHPNVITVGGVSRLYTLERAAGDNAGVGMLVHTLASSGSNPLSTVPSSERAGVDPDSFSAAATAVPATGGVTINLANPIGSGPEQLVAGPFVDLTATPTPTAGSVITCTGVGTQSLTGCTAANAAGENVAAGDLIEQVLATVSSNLAGATPATGCSAGSTTPTLTGTGTLPCNVPAGPNTTTGDAGLAGFGVTVANSNNLNMAIFNSDAPNRAYIDGVPVYCSQANAFPTNKVENCTTGPAGTALTVSAGDPITSDPIVPATAQQTSGLVAPDGIVGVLPSFPGAPSGSTVVMYTEKILNYYIVGFTGGKTTFSNNMSLSYTSFPSTGSVSLGSGPTYSVYIGDATTNTIVTETCTGLTTTATGGTLTGCNGGTPKDSITKNSYLGGPGASTVPPATLKLTGEGSATNAQKLFKNNEDLTVLRVAYTTDGLNFSTTGLTNNGVISGQGTEGSSYDDITNPSSTVSPANLNAYSTAGTSLATEMRYVGSAGSIIVNPDGSDGLFLSGAWAADGDSDAFNQIFYTSSTDGEHWTVPVDVVSTDYTFSASAAQEQALAGGQDTPLGISAYYSGRAYGPSVVQNPDGTLTMMFAGYRLPSPTASVGSVFGTNPAALYTVGSQDPSAYRNILVDTLSSATSPLVATATTLTGPSPAAVVGQPVTFTASVAPVAPGTGTPTGSVTFAGSGGTLCAAVTLVNGSASCTTTYTSAGPDTVTAQYSGDTNYASSVSSGLSVNVGRATTTTTVATSGPSTYGQAVTFTASVAPDDGLGAVGFSDGTSAINGCGTQPLQLVGSTYQAQCTTSALSAGAHTISAAYSGDPNYAASSGTVAQQVSPAPLAVTASSGSYIYGSTPPVISPHFGAFQNQDNASSLPQPVSCSTVATNASAVSGSPYASTCTGPATDGNYALTFLPGSVTENPAPLTVTANNASRAFGAANPPLSATVSGFVLGQTLATSGVSGSAACTTTATAQSAPGNYPITCTVGTLTASNYSFTSFVGGTLTVAQAGTTLVAAPVTLLGSILSLGPVYSATLTSQATGAPVAGRVVTFSLIPGLVACSAVTNAKGVATCTGSTLSIVLLLLYNHYTATYAGDADFTGSSARGVITLL